MCFNDSVRASLKHDCCISTASEASQFLFFGSHLFCNRPSRTPARIRNSLVSFSKFSPFRTFLLVAQAENIKEIWFCSRRPTQYVDFYQKRNVEENDFELIQKGVAARPIMGTPWSNGVIPYEFAPNISKLSQTNEDLKKVLNEVSCEPHGIDCPNDAGNGESHVSQWNTMYSFPTEKRIGNGLHHHLQWVGMLCTRWFVGKLCGCSSRVAVGLTLRNLYDLGDYPTRIESCFGYVEYIFSPDFVQCSFAI